MIYCDVIDGDPVRITRTDNSDGTMHASVVFEESGFRCVVSCRDQPSHSEVVDLIRRYVADRRQSGE